MFRRLILCGAGCAALLLSGCNQGSPVAAAPPPPTDAQAAVPAPAPGQLASLPAGAPCTDKINRYQAVLSDDVRTGNLERPVYNQIQTELSKAAGACTAGHGREALGLVKASEARHGYHV